MVERLGFPADEVAEACADFYLNYGTTLAGLVAHGYKVDYDDWHAQVHGSLPYEQYLQVRELVCSGGDERMGLGVNRGWELGQCAAAECLPEHGGQSSQQASRCPR